MIIDADVPRRVALIKMRTKNGETWDTIERPGHGAVWWTYQDRGTLILRKEEVDKSLTDAVTRSAWWAAQAGQSPITLRLYTPEAVGVFLAREQLNIVRDLCHKSQAGDRVRGMTYQDFIPFANKQAEGFLGLLDGSPAPFLDAQGWEDYLSLRMCRVGS